MGCEIQSASWICELDMFPIRAFSDLKPYFLDGTLSALR